MGCSHQRQLNLNDKQKNIFKSSHIFYIDLEKGRPVKSSIEPLDFWGNLQAIIAKQGWTILFV